MEEDTKGDAEEYTEGDTEEVMGEGRGGDTVGDKTGRTDVAVWVKGTGRGGRDGGEAPPAYVVVGREHSAERNRREGGTEETGRRGWDGRRRGRREGGDGTERMGRRGRDGRDGEGAGRCGWEGGGATRRWDGGAGMAETARRDHNLTPRTRNRLRV